VKLSYPFGFKLTINLQVNTAFAGFCLFFVIHLGR